jgi:hypothetical protein
MLSQLDIDAALHVGGNLADSILSNQTVSGGRKVFAPKCSGIKLLQESTGLRALAKLVVFSSISSLLGNAGQANCASPRARCVSTDSSALTAACLSAAFLLQTRLRTRVWTPGHIAAAGRASRG